MIIYNPLARTAKVVYWFVCTPQVWKIVISIPLSMYKVERILAQNPCVSMLRGMHTCEEKLEDDKRALRSYTCKDILFPKNTFEREDNRFNPVTIFRVSLHKPSLFKLSFHNC